MRTDELTSSNYDDICAGKLSQPLVSLAHSLATMFASDGIGILGGKIYHAQIYWGTYALKAHNVIPLLH